MTDRPVIANLDFQEIKTDIVDYFKNREEFADYEFTGSGLNLLMDILSYNTHYYSLAANFLMNESFLDTAILRKNVVSLAKVLNYTPRSIRSASSTVTLAFDKQDANDKIVTIPAGSIFTATEGNSTVTFYTVEDYVLQFLSSEAIGTTKTIDVIVYEGKYQTQAFASDRDYTDFSRWTLPQKNIDTTTLVVSINGVQYTKILPEDETIFDLNGDSTNYFIEENRDGGVDIVFGNGVVGKPISYGDQIVVSYLSSNGEDGNGISYFSPSVSGRTDVRITAVSTSQGGSSKESIQEIKDYAPKWYQSQYRAVTTNDYEAIIRNKFGDIQAIKVYGGEDVGKPGKVFIAIKPKSSDTLTDSAKYVLKQEIIKSSNIVTVTPEIVDANIVELILKTVVIYDKTKTALDSNVIKAKVVSLQNVLNTEYIGDFGKPFRESNFSYELQDLDNSIISSNTRTTIKVSSAVNSTTNLLEKLQFDLYNKFYHPEDGFKAVFSSSYFKRVGQSVFSGFDDDGNGNIRLFDLRDNKKVYINSNAGTIDYSNGVFEISSSITIQDSSVSFYVVPDSFDIEASYDNILMISEDESVIDVIESKETTLLKNLNLSRSI